MIALTRHDAGAGGADRRHLRIRKALKELFEGEDYVPMFKRREICRHLDNSAERVLHCANTLHDVVVKMI